MSFQISEVFITITTMLCNNRTTNKVHRRLATLFTADFEGGQVYPCKCIVSDRTASLNREFN
jgi:hypothetical protein